MILYKTPGLYFIIVLMHSISLALLYYSSLLGDASKTTGDVVWEPAAKDSEEEPGVHRVQLIGYLYKASCEWHKNQWVPTV